MSKVTVVGCGVMGSRLVGALMNAGHEVVIIELNKQAAEPFIEKGAQYSESLQDAPETPVVILNCPSHKVAKIVMSGCTKERMAGKTLINTTTCGPKDVEEMTEIAKNFEMDYLEAKIECYPQEVGTDRGYIMYSGSKKVYEEKCDIIKAFGKSTFLDESPKAACVVDISFLGVHYGAMIALIEAAAFCHNNGFSMQKLGDQLRMLLPDGMEANYLSLVDEFSGEYTGEFEDSQGTDIFIEKRGAIYCKEAMNSTGVDSIFTDWLIDKFDMAIEAGDGHKNIIAMVKQMLH